MKACGGVDVYVHIFLTSALAGGEWSASRSGRYTPGERTPGTLSKNNIYKIYLKLYMPVHIKNIYIKSQI
jgi:hypothetical protein